MPGETENNDGKPLREPGRGEGNDVCRRIQRKHVPYVEERTL